MVNVKVSVVRRRATVPVKNFVGVPGRGLPGQFLAFDNTWQYPDAAVSTITKIAHGVLSGHRVVHSYSLNDVAYPDQTDYVEVRKIIGITTGAAADGGEVVIQDKGILIEPTWLWSEGDVWLGSSGQLTQIQPASGCLVRIGSAIGTTALQIGIEFIVQL